MDYASYMVKNILQPLQMTSSGFLTADANRKMLAKGYFYEENSGTFRQTPFFKPNSAIYAGGLYTTANDLAKFLSFQFETHSASADHVLSVDNKAMMVADNISWRPSYPLTTHEGSMIGYRSEIVFDPDLKIGWVVLTNNSDINFSGLNNDISKLILPLYERKYPIGLEQYAGTYQLAGSAGSIQIYLKDGALHSTYLKGVVPDVPLTPAGTDRFKGAGKGAYNIFYEFTRQEHGAIKAVNMGQLMWVKQWRVTIK